MGQDSSALMQGGGAGGAGIVAVGVTTGLPPSFHTFSASRQQKGPVLPWFLKMSDGVRGKKMWELLENCH